MTVEFKVSGFVNTCCHSVSWWFRGQSEVSDNLKALMAEHAEERARSKIIEGYNQGELNFLDTDTETEYTGWWNISRE